MQSSYFVTVYVKVNADNIDQAKRRARFAAEAVDRELGDAAPGYAWWDVEFDDEGADGR